MQYLERKEIDYDHELSCPMNCLRGTDNSRANAPIAVDLTVQETQAQSLSLQDGEVQAPPTPPMLPPPVSDVQRDDAHVGPESEPRQPLTTQQLAAIAENREQALMRQRQATANRLPQVKTSSLFAEVDY